MFNVTILDQFNIVTGLSSLDFFDSYNSIFPLFDRGVFDKSYDLQYSGNPPSGPAWYACLNIVLCIGCLLFQVRPQGEPNNSPGDLNWKKYFRNASSCFTDLLFEDGSLQAIQAIVGMVSILGLICTQINVFIRLSSNKYLCSHRLCTS